MPMPKPTLTKRTPEEPIEESVVDVEESLGAEESVNIQDSFTPDNNTFNMLFGYRDSKTGEIFKDFEVRDLTGGDAEAIQRPNVRKNGATVLMTALARCVTRIGNLYAKDFSYDKWYEMIRSLYVGDQDYMISCLRKYSDDSPIEATHICPNPDCKAKLITEFEIDELEVVPFKSDSIPFELPRGYKDKRGVVHRSGKLRLVNGLDREILIPIALQSLAKAETLMLTRTMTFDDGFHIDDDVTRGLSLKDRSYLAELQQEFFFGLKTEIELTCDTCGEVFNSTVSATNFI